MSGSSSKPIINICPHCKGKVDASIYVPFSKVICPYCNEAIRVRHLVNKRFLIEKQMGEGGMSQIFRAVDQETGETVALKLLNWVNSQDPERVRAFEREAQLTDQVRSEHVIKLYGQGWDGNMFFYAMELLEGGGLDELMAHGPIRMDEVIEYATQAVEGLRAADNINLLHRDVKPANLMLDKEGKLRLVDFGLALMHDEEKSDEIWATPWYVPPETLRNEKDTAASDIYALGMTFRHALVGKAPFDGDLVDPNKLLERKRTLPKLNCYFPKARHSLSKLVEILDSMTEFEPSKRTSSYAELAQKLEKLHQRKNLAHAKGLSLEEYDKKQELKTQLCWLLILVPTVLFLIVLGLYFLEKFSPQRESIPEPTPTPVPTNEVQTGVPRK